MSGNRVPGPVTDLVTAWRAGESPAPSILALLLASQHSCNILEGRQPGRELRIKGGEKRDNRLRVPLTVALAWPAAVTTVYCALLFGLLGGAAEEPLKRPFEMVTKPLTYEPTADLMSLDRPGDSRSG